MAQQQLTLELLGGLSIRDAEGRTLDSASRKAHALLAYLALSPNGTRSREHLAALLWSRSAEDQARASLRQTLWVLRKLVSDNDEELIRAYPDYITLDNSRIQVDVREFEALAEHSTRQTLAGAAAYYRGDFLDGFSLRESAFEDWSLSERRRLNHLATKTLARLINLHEQAGQIGESLDSARRLVDLDPLNEAGNHALVRLYLKQGERNKAIQQYEAYRLLLETELGVQPDDPLKALYNKAQNLSQPSALTDLPGVTRLQVDRPSLAVLPFPAQSEDARIAWLADALTEDISILLARIPGFFVISRNSTFAYKGRATDVHQVGEELGVQYIVEGSLREAGSSLRVSVQLTDAETRRHLWADQSDIAAHELHKFQDEIVREIVVRIEPELNRAELAALRHRHSVDLDAWSLYREAHAILGLKGWSEQTFAESTDLLRQAIDRDPHLAFAHAYLALVLAMGHLVGLVKDPGTQSEARQAAERAVALESLDSDVLGYAGCALADLGETARGVEMLERAIELDPSNAQAWAALGAALLISGRLEEGIERLRHGIRISPRDNRLGVWGTMLARGLLHLGCVDEAINAARAACRCNNKIFMPRIVLAAACVVSGTPAEGSAALAEARRIRPQLTIEEIAQFAGDEAADALRRAGLI